MANNGTDDSIDARLTVEGSSIDDIADALEIERAERDPEPPEPSEHPEELLTVLETVTDIYRGVEEATEQDERGRSRKMVRQYADREDLTSNEVGHLLRVLEIQDLVVQDGNRWRLSADEPE